MLFHYHRSSYERISDKILQSVRRKPKKGVYFDGQKVVIFQESQHKTPEGSMYRAFWRLKIRRYNSEFKQRIAKFYTEGE